MQCHEVQEHVGRFIDGKVDDQTRRQVGLHLAGCDECMRLFNDDRTWDDAVMSLLDREAPEGLRSEILGELTDANPSPGRSDLSSLGWKKQLKIIGWAATRKGSPRQWLTDVAFVIGVILLVQVILRLMK